MKDGTLVVLKVDGTKEALRVPGELKVEQLQKLVGGWVEPVRIKYEGRMRTAFVNENGKLLGLKPNFRATCCFKAANIIPTSDFIVGNMAVWLPTPVNKEKAHGANTFCG